MTITRNYKREAAIETPARKAARAQRNRARREMVNRFGKAAVAGKDVNHIKAISRGGGNSLANLNLETPAVNRSFARNSDKSMKSEISTRERKKRKS